MFVTPKPLVAEARQYKGGSKCRVNMVTWRGGPEFAAMEDGYFYILTEDEGYRQMEAGDWLMKYTEDDGTILWGAWSDEEFQEQWQELT